MIKLIGCMIAFLACTFIGFMLAKSISDRVKEIKAFIHALNILETEIKFALCTLPEAFYKISGMVEAKVGEVFEAAAHSIQDAKDNASQAWKAALSEKEQILSLNGDDKAALATLGDSLGEVDADSQIKSIRLVIEQLKYQESKALEEKSKSGKLLKNLGVLVGLTIVIILF